LFALGSFFSSLVLRIVGKSPRTRDQPVAKPLCKSRITQIQKNTQIYMARMGFEHALSVLEKAKTVHCWDEQFHVELFIMKNCNMFTNHIVYFVFTSELQRYLGINSPWYVTFLTKTYTYIDRQPSSAQHVGPRLCCG
jgi:hypothetical protein